MSSFLDVVESQFGSKDLYGALLVEKSAKDSEIRRAYHRLSLKVHPDRVEPGDVEAATQKFQVCHITNVWLHFELPPMILNLRIESVQYFTSPW